MILQIPEILSADECSAICENLSREEIWTDGKATAAGAARAAKSNEQAASGNRFVVGALKKVQNTLSLNTLFEAVARPEKFARTLFNRYGETMAYGAHVDAPYIEGIRTDISITVFLSDPETYDGGELCIMHPGHVDEIKPAIGTAVIYPSTSLHEVRPVTKGERIAFVGWVKSRIRSAEHRAILFDLDQAIAILRKQKTAQGNQSEATTSLNNVRNNLIRLFGD